MVSVCSLKGGVGKTSMILGLASSALSRGVPTLVVDLDPQADATLALDISGDAEVDVATLLGNPRRKTFDAAVTPSGWVPVASGSTSSPAPPRARHTTAAGRRSEPSPGWGRRWPTTDDYRLVIIDCPPSFGGLTRSGLVASNRAMVVTEPALFSVTAADRALRAIDDLRRAIAPDLQPLGVIVNRYRDRSPEHRYRVTELADMFGPLVLTPTIPERARCSRRRGRACRSTAGPARPRPSSAGRSTRTSPG